MIKIPDIYYPCAGGWLPANHLILCLQMREDEHAPAYEIAKIYFGLDPELWARPLLNLSLIYSEVKAAYDYEDMKKRKDD